MKIDKEEFIKQNKDGIIQSGEYIKVEIVVGEGNPVPYANAVVNNVSSESVCKTILSMEEMIKTLEHRFPECIILKRLLAVEDLGSTITGKQEV